MGTEDKKLETSAPPEKSKDTPEKLKNLGASLAEGLKNTFHSKESLIFTANKKLKTPKKAPNKPKEKPEKPRYFTLPKGIKLRILSQREKNKLGIKEARDTIAPKIKNQGRPISPAELATIRKTSEFWDPNNSGIPLSEVSEKDLDKVILICGTKKNPVKYKLKEFLRIDPKDIGDAPKGTYFEKDKNGEYYRKITRLSPKIIEKFGRLHQELERVVNENTPKPPKIKGKKTRNSSRKSVKLYIDENYRSYGENLCNYVKKGTVGEDLKLYSQHIGGKALDLQTFIMIDGVKISTFVWVENGEKDKNGKPKLIRNPTKTEGILRKAVSAEWKKSGGGRGFYKNSRNFHIDARPKRGQWGKW